MSVGHVRTGRPAHEQSSIGSSIRKTKSRLKNWANQDSLWTTKRANSRWLWSRDSQTRVPSRLWQKKHLKIEWSYRVSKRRNLSCSCWRRTIRRSTTSSWTIIGTNSGSSWSSDQKSSWNERIEEFKSYESMNFREEDWSRIRTLLMNDSRDFKDVESVRSGLYHVSSQPAFLPPYRDPGRLLSRNNRPPVIWNSQGISGNVFVNPLASSSAPHPQQSNPWISNVSEHTSPHVMSESQTPAQASEMPVRTVSQKLSHPLWGRIFKELWSRPTKTADLETSLWQIPYTKNICLLEDKTPSWGMYFAHNFVRKLCCGSKKWRWLNQWMIWNFRVL